jgi:hypothetical protein
MICDQDFWTSIRAYIKTTKCRMETQLMFHAKVDPGTVPTLKVHKFIIPPAVLRETHPISRDFAF